MEASVTIVPARQPKTVRQAEATQVRRPAAKGPGRVAGVPTPEVSPEISEVLRLLSNPQVTGNDQNPAWKNDAQRDKAVVQAFTEAKRGDGKITKEEFEDILQEYYGLKRNLFFDVITDEAWEAFTGKSGMAAEKGVTLKELAHALRFFRDYRSNVMAYSLNWFLALDEVTILGGSEMVEYLQNSQLYRLLGSQNLDEHCNPEVKKAWEAAQAITKGSKGDRKTEAWFCTILMTRLVDKLKEAHDLDDIDFEHPLMRQLFGEYVIRWALKNEEINEKEWDALVKSNKTIEKMEETEYSLKDIRLHGPQQLKDAKQALRLYEQDPKGNKPQIDAIINRLREGSAPKAAPQVPLQAQP